MEALLSNILEEDIKIIKYYNTELGVKTTYEREKRLDALIKADDKIIHLELNTNFDKSVRYRNYIFFEAFHSSKVRKGQEYDYNALYYHIDLSFNLGNNHKPVDTFEIKNNDEMLYVDNVKFYVVNMDLIKKFWYDKDESNINKYKYLTMIDLSKEEIERYAIFIKDHLVSKYKKELITMNDEFSFDDFIPPEKDREMLFNARLKEHSEEITKKVTKEVTSKVTKQSKIDIAKNMINQNFKDEDIIRATNITKKELQEIKDSF